jgi:hypothetical protein
MRGVEESLIGGRGGDGLWRGHGGEWLLRCGARFESRQVWSVVLVLGGRFGWKFSAFLPVHWFATSWIGPRAQLR